MWRSKQGPTFKFESTIPRRRWLLSKSRYRDSSLSTWSVRSTHGAPVDFEEAARDSNGRNYWALVPKATDVALKFDPGQLNISRSDGTKVSATDSALTVRGVDAATSVSIGAGKGPAAPPSTATATFLRFRVN